MKSKLLTLLALLSISTISYGQAMTEEELAKYELQEYVDSLSTDSNLEVTKDIAKKCVACEQSVDMILEFDHLSRGSENSGSELSSSHGGSAFFNCQSEKSAEVYVSSEKFKEKGVTERPYLLFGMTGSRCNKMAGFLNELPKELFTGPIEERMKVCLGMNFPRGTADQEAYHTYESEKGDIRKQYYAASEHLQVLYVAKECTTNNIMSSHHFIMLKR